MAFKRFVLIAEGDVFLQLSFDDENSHPRAAAWSAGLLSNPICIEVTDKPEVVPGWTWNGTEFIPPQ
jgi:hypothetical protein